MMKLPRFLCLLMMVVPMDVAVAGWIGSPNTPPVDRPEDVLLYDDFEGESTMDSAISGTTSSYTTEKAYRGLRSLKMCAGDSCKFSERIRLPEENDVLYARYMLLVGNHEAWYDASGKPRTGEHYKNPGLEGGSTDCKGGSYSGDGCVTSRTRLLTPYYGVHLEGFTGNTDSVDKTINVVDGQWHCMEMKVQLNTPGKADGEVRYWVDGHENVLPGLTFRNDLSWSVDKWWWTYWSNDNWLGPTYVDEMIVSKSRIGCSGEPGTSACDSPGDLNADGAITATDLQMLVNILLGINSESPCGDVDGNDVVDITDLQAVVNVILGS